MMEMLKIQKDLPATAKEPEPNLENVPKNKVRSIGTLPIHEKTKNLILGSSIIARINPYEVHETQGYSGSTSEEKLAVTSKLEKKKLKAVKIQNGTNSVLKHKNGTVEEKFQHYQDLIKQIEVYHEPEKNLPL